MRGHWGEIGGAAVSSWLCLYHAQIIWGKELCRMIKYIRVVCYYSIEYLPTISSILHIDSCFVKEQ